MLKLLCTLSILLVLSDGKSFKNNDEVVWFPNPNGDGSLIEAKLTPTVGAKAGDVKDIHFRLFTDKNPDEFQEIFLDNMESIDNSNFITGAPLKLMVHGFGGNYTHAFPSDLRKEYVRADMDQSHNVILVDWSHLSKNPDYFMAVENAQIVSQLAADLLNFLVDAGKADFSTIHLVGYSLGGQVVGQIGHKLAPNKVSRLTALDPALPLFDYMDDVHKTDPTDAEFVDVMHTSANGLLGYWDPLGHVDWYPNGGRFQPGCGVDPTGACGHARAPAMFAESVFATALKFWGRRCDTYEDFKSGACDSAQKEIMGHHTPRETRGIFFLDSNNKSPFAIGDLLP